MGISLRTTLTTIAALMFLLTPSAGLAQAPAPACVQQTFEDARFTVCAFDADRDELLLVVRDASGKAYRRLPKLAQALGGDGPRVRFAMNAGMFDGKGAPSGSMSRRTRR